MTMRLSRILIAICGILGTALLGTYFGVGFSIGLAQLPPDVTTAQVVSVATQYHNMWFLGAWLQATGSLLSVIFTPILTLVVLTLQSLWVVAAAIALLVGSGMASDTTGVQERERATTEHSSHT
jgi:hypothetical protein